MKRKKGIIYLLLVIIMLTSCTSSVEVIDIVNELLTDGINGLKEKDDEKIKKAFGEDSELLNYENFFSLSDNEIDEELKEKLEKVYENIFENISYSINDRKKVDGIWTMDVTITSNNLKDLILNSLSSLKDQIINDKEGLDSGKYVESVILETYMDILIKNIEIKEFLDNFNVEIMLKKSGKDFFINADESLINALFGNLLNDSKDIEEEVNNILDEFEKELDIKLNDKNE